MTLAERLRALADELETVNLYRKQQAPTLSPMDADFVPATPGDLPDELRRTADQLDA